jgi:hypothetical protein
MKPLDEPEVGAWLQKVAEDYRVAEMLAQSKTQVLAYRCVRRVVGAGSPAPTQYDATDTRGRPGFLL